MRRPHLASWSLFGLGSMLLLASLLLPAVRHRPPPPEPECAAPPAPPPAPPPVATPAPPRLGLAVYVVPPEQLDIAALGTDEYLVGAKAIARLKADGIAQQMRIVPSFADGRPQGFKIFALRPSSVYAELGFMNGDIIERMNETDLTEPEKALGAYAALKEAHLVTVTLTRQGNRRTLRYFIPGTAQGGD